MFFLIDDMSWIKHRSLAINLTQPFNAITRYVTFDPRHAYKIIKVKWNILRLVLEWCSKHLLNTPRYAYSHNAKFIWQCLWEKCYIQCFDPLFWSLLYAYCTLMIGISKFIVRFPRPKRFNTSFHRAPVFLKSVSIQKFVQSM